MDDKKNKKNTPPTLEEKLSRREAMKRMAKGLALAGSIGVTAIVTQGQSECGYVTTTTTIPTTTTAITITTTITTTTTATIITTTITTTITITITTTTCIKIGGNRPDRSSSVPICRRGPRYSITHYLLSFPGRTLTDIGIFFSSLSAIGE
jgi:hypothetical protein